MSQIYSKPLSQILSVLPQSYDVEELTVKTICSDSRKATDGSLFCAVKGLNNDARDHIESAINQGAVAVIYEANAVSKSQQAVLAELSVPLIPVDNLHEYLGLIASVFFDSPSKEMHIYGMTGTNGKTSCAYMLAQCLEGLGYKTGFLGTIGYGEIQTLSFSTHTTLDAISLQSRLAEMRDLGFSHVCMEVSSHALDQARVKGVEFYGVMFTNLTHDHLDYHGTIDSYADAKYKLFADFDSKFAIINVNDKYGERWLENTRSEFIVGYGAGGDVYADDVQTSINGLSLHIETDSIDFPITTSLVGMINVPNILLLVSTLLVLGVEIEDIQAQLSNVQAAPGRMELFSVDGLPIVIVDYAHTPDALERTIASLKEHCQGQLWCVFGCGGDRDVEKRQVMGSVASKLSDRVIITSDNPRTEDAQKIIADIVEGVDDVASVTVIENREQAIHWAVSEAKPNDWILVAGKGHEDYQIVGKEKIPYSDRVWVTECLEAAA